MEIKDLEQYEGLWKNNGKLSADSSERISLSDALSTPNASNFMSKVITNIVREAAEPVLSITPMLQRLNWTGQVINYGGIGAIGVADDIAEGAEYPEANIATSSGTQITSCGKVGLAVKITEEMVKRSQYDIIGMILRQAGYDLARKKEQKALNMIRRAGTVVFDNVTPAASLKGVCTGRDIDGSGNGACTMDDVFDTFAQAISQGYTPDTICLHPLTWVMWIKDPTLRAFALASGGGTMFGGWNGNAAAGNPWGSASGLGFGGGQNIIPGSNAAGLTASTLGNYPAKLTVSPVIPGYLGIPFRIVISPFIYFNPARKLTDIYMFDSKSLGALIVEDEVTIDEWNDPRVDIKKIKLKERYAMAIMNEGQGIVKMQNVHVVANQLALPVQATVESSASLSPLSPTADVL